MSGSPDMGNSMHKSAKANLCGRVSKDGAALVLRDAQLRCAPQDEGGLSFGLLGYR